MLTSSAPTRVDLAGGTIDIWPLYLFHDRASTLNAAISVSLRCATQNINGSFGDAKAAAGHWV